MKRGLAPHLGHLLEGRGWAYRGRCVLRPDTGAVEKEADRRQLLSLPLAEGVHELAECRRPLDLKEDFVVVVRDFDVQVLDGSGGRSVSTETRVGHGVVVMGGSF